MNVNGSRFHLLLGQADWGRCRVERNDGLRALRDWWAEPSAAIPDLELTPELAPELAPEPSLESAPRPGPAAIASNTQEPAPFTWDDLRNDLRLQRRPVELPATPGEVPFRLDARRAAAADRNGNLYWIDADRRRLRLRSIGSGREAAFWPADPADCAGDRRQFGPISGVAGPDPDYQALAVTEDHYLVVAYHGATGGGLLAFDLVAGGPPMRCAGPRVLPSRPLRWHRAPAAGSGSWIGTRVGSGNWIGGLR